VHILNHEVNVARPCALLRLFFGFLGFLHCDDLGEISVAWALDFLIDGYLATTVPIGVRANQHRQIQSLLEQVLLGVDDLLFHASVLFIGHHDRLCSPIEDQNSLEIPILQQQAILAFNLSLQQMVSGDVGHTFFVFEGQDFAIHFDLGKDSIIEINLICIIELALALALIARLQLHVRQVHVAKIDIENFEVSCGPEHGHFLRGELLEQIFKNFLVARVPGEVCVFVDKIE